MSFLSLEKLIGSVSVVLLIICIWQYKDLKSQRKINEHLSSSVASMSDELRRTSLDNSNLSTQLDRQNRVILDLNHNKKLYEERIQSLSSSLDRYREDTSNLMTRVKLIQSQDSCDNTVELLRSYMNESIASWN